MGMTMDVKGLYTPKARFSARETRDKFDFAIQSKFHSLDFTLDDFDIGAFVVNLKIYSGRWCPWAGFFGKGTTYRFYLRVKMHF